MADKQVAEHEEVPTWSMLQEPFGTAVELIKVTRDLIGLGAKALKEDGAEKVEERTKLLQDMAATLQSSAAILMDVKPQIMKEDPVKVETYQEFLNVSEVIKGVTDVLMEKTTTNLGWTEDL